VCLGPRVAASSWKQVADRIVPQASASKGARHSLTTHLYDHSSLPVVPPDVVSVDDALCVIVCATCAKTFSAPAFAPHIERCKKEMATRPQAPPRQEAAPQQRAPAAHRQPAPAAHENPAPRVKAAPKAAVKKPVRAAPGYVYEEIPVGGGGPGAGPAVAYRERSGRVRHADTQLEAQYAILDQVTKAKADRGKARRLFNRQDQDTDPVPTTPERVSDRIQRKRRRSEATPSPREGPMRLAIPEVVPKPRVDRAWLATEFDSAGGATGARVAQRPPPPGPRPLARFVHPQWRSELRMQIQSALAARRKLPSVVAVSQPVFDTVVPPITQPQKANPTQAPRTPAVPCRVGGV